MDSSRPILPYVFFHLPQYEESLTTCAGAIDFQLCELALLTRGRWRDGSDLRRSEEAAKPAHGDDNG